MTIEDEIGTTMLEESDECDECDGSGWFFIDGEPLECVCRDGCKDMFVFESAGDSLGVVEWGHPSIENLEGERYVRFEELAEALKKLHAVRMELEEVSTTLQEELDEQI